MQRYRILARESSGGPNVPSTKSGVTESDFLTASEALLPELGTLDGFIRRELLKGEDGRWLDVLAFHASEVAEMLGVTEVSVNRMLQRARQTRGSRGPPWGSFASFGLPRTLREPPV